MADVSEEIPSSNHNIESAKSSIFDTLNKLKKWREEQMAECRKKQHQESQRSLQLTRENHKQFEHLLENGIKHQHSDFEDRPQDIVPEISNISVISLPNDFDNCDTLQESSITGHLERCFDDSTQSVASLNSTKVPHVPEKVPVFSELRNSQFSEKNPEEKDSPLEKTGPTNSKNKPKRPFLKKGSGLLRYRPKSANSHLTSNNKVSPKVIRAQLPQKTLKLKPALRKTDAPSENVRHIRFDITDSNDDEDLETLTNNNLQSKTNENETGAFIHEENRAEYSIPATCPSAENNRFDSSNSGSESLNLSGESKELEEFEMLENCAQNSSFNSDSSIVQRILQGGSAKPPNLSENYSRLPSQNSTSTKKEIYISASKNPNFSESISMNKCFEEVQARKQMLQGVISDINPRIESLQKEISCDMKASLDDSDISDRCSTPVNSEDRIPSSGYDTNICSSVFDGSPEVQIDRFVDDANKSISPSDCTCCNVNNVCKNYFAEQDHAHICSDKGCTCNYSSEVHESDQDLCGKSKFRDKVMELHNEMETYQQLNARLTLLCKERDDTVRKLQKERDDFSKYKEAEMQKLEAHIQEERRQIKRQKETFMRYQKLRKDNPTKKERDELNALRLEIEKLNEDLKRQKIKYNSDSRRWKSRFDIAEKERDTFKLENIRLEEQCQDLLAALKTRMKKNMKSLDDDGVDADNNENVKHVTETKDAESQTEEKGLDFNVFQESNESSSKSSDMRIPKSKVPFGLVAELEKNVDIADKDLGIHAKDPSRNSNSYPQEKDLINECDSNREGNIGKPATNVNLSVISVSGEAAFQEINHGNSIERIYPSGEREILYNSGTRKVITSDGKSRKFFFYNGDVKEIFSDSREIYTYISGVIETTFPDGLKITEFPNGQIQRRYPNGQKEVRFKDGTIHNILVDGSEEIRTADGKLVKNCADGTKITELPNGQREIITSSYKRREFPDGSIKILYHSGRQESRYSNGRIKIRDKEGKILFDTKYLSTRKG